MSQQMQTKPKPVSKNTGSKREEIQAMFKEANEKYGKVDVLVNNAGIARDGLMVRMKPEQWQQVRRREKTSKAILNNLSDDDYILTSF